MAGRSDGHGVGRGRCGLAHPIGMARLGWQRRDRRAQPIPRSAHMGTLDLPPACLSRQRRSHRSHRREARICLCRLERVRRAGQRCPNSKRHRVAGSRPCRTSHPDHMLAAAHRRVSRGRDRAAGQHLSCNGALTMNHGKSTRPNLKSRKRFLMALLVVLVFIGVRTPAKADGLLFSNGVFRQPLSSHINVTIKDKIATTQLEQTFENALDKQVSAVYIAPIPADATVTGFAEQIDGEWKEATIQTSEAARAQYDSAASKGQDAAVAEGIVSDVPPGLDPKTTFQTRVILPAKASRSLRLTYTEVLSGDVGLTRYNYPLSNTNWTDEPVGDLQVNV